MMVTKSTTRNNALIGAARRPAHAGVLAACLATSLAAGCSGGPSRVKPPSISPSGAASEAMEMYDKDGDGFLAGAELDASPGIKAAMATIDGDKDGKVTADEIQARIEAWQATKIGVMSVSCLFKMDGRPLDGATVTCEPESFLGDNLKAGVGETGRFGTVSPSIPKDQRPTADTPPGFQVGLYRIHVSKKLDGKETIPAKYNAETVLGQQIAADDPAIKSQRVQFELTSK